MKEKVRVSLLGKNYTLCGDVSAEYMKKVAQFVDKKYRELKESFPEGDKVELLLLLSLNLADELLQLKEKTLPPSTLKEMERKTRLLIQLIEKRLIGEIPTPEKEKALLVHH